MDFNINRYVIVSSGFNDNEEYAETFTILWKHQLFVTYKLFYYYLKFNYPYISTNPLNYYVSDDLGPFH